MSDVFTIIKVCYVHNQWYDISCATLYNMSVTKPMVTDTKFLKTRINLNYF